MLYNSGCPYRFQISLYSLNCGEYWYTYAVYSQAVVGQIIIKVNRAHFKPADCFNRIFDCPNIYWSIAVLPVYIYIYSNHNGRIQQHLKGPG